MHIKSHCEKDTYCMVPTVYNSMERIEKSVVASGKWNGWKHKRFLGSGTILYYIAMGHTCHLHIYQNLLNV